MAQGESDPDGAAASFGQQPVDQLSWGHNILIFTKRIYGLAKSNARIDRERGMRRRRLRSYVDRSQALQGKALTRDPLRMTLGAARHEAGRAAHPVK